MYQRVNPQTDVPVAKRKVFWNKNKRYDVERGTAEAARLAEDRHALELGTRTCEDAESQRRQEKQAATNGRAAAEQHEWQQQQEETAREEEERRRRAESLRKERDQEVRSVIAR